MIKRMVNWITVRLTPGKQLDVVEAELRQLLTNRAIAVRKIDSILVQIQASIKRLLPESTGSDENGSNDSDTQ